jgi:DNA-binding PadR family transcriptional regulator
LDDQKDPLWVPLASPAEYAILYVLQQRPMDGTGIYNAVKQETAGELKILHQRIYPLIHQLQARAWVEPNGLGGKLRNKQYQITQNGREALRDEFARSRRFADLDHEKENSHGKLDCA